MNRVAEDILMHYGVGALDGAPGRGSGRYPLGSGGTPYQHSGDFLTRIDKLKKEGLSETEIARMMGFVRRDKDGNVVKDRNGREIVSTTQFRAAKSIASSERRCALVATAKQLRDEGYSLNEIAARMGYKNDSSVRSLLNEDSAARMNMARTTADFLKTRVAADGMIDVGVGVEREIGVSQTKLNEALEILKMEGYQVYDRRLQQVTNPGKFTTLHVLCPPGTEYKDVYETDKIHSLRDYVSHDGGETFDPKWVYPKSMESKRLAVCYDEDGGTQKDGLVEIRRGVDDLSLGNSHYAQVRILVDGTHYIKGMAVYADDLPDGVDVRFHTNKKRGTPMTKVLKEITDDPDNPFGSLIKEGIVDPDDPTKVVGGQSYYYDKNGVKQLSLINKRAEEGDWGDWKDKVPAQFLAKQSLELIRRQLGIAIDDKVAEYDEICSYNNPTVKKALLKSFADDCDSAAIHLQAAALPRQKYQVILPLTSIKDTEVYAPGYKDGETVALVRYPFAGNFEMPILTVNNKLPEGKSVLGTSPKDVVGINKKVADRMSGADFDGDTVMVIPCNSSTSKVRLKSDRPLFGDEGFDTHVYGADKEVKDASGVTHYYRNGREYHLMSEGLKQTQMGIVSNLITDMTLRGATREELAKAVKHSMVVIDSVKHHLDYKQSEADNDIKALKARYQGRYDEEGGFHTGASTLISRAKNEVSVDKRQGTPYINQQGKSWFDSSKPEGTLLYKTADDLYYTDKKTGKTIKRTQQSTQMAETSDARTLISEANTPQERAYAEYANTMKSLANQARKEMVTTGRIVYSASAKAAYQTEVDSLMAQLNVALKNAPRERDAQRIANITVDAKKQSNPDMTKAEIKKAGQQALTAARNQVGAQRAQIRITDREWEAIQAGAISENLLTKILDNTNIDDIKERATPRTSKELSPAKISRISSLKANGYTTEEIAQAVGVSTSTVTKYM